MQWRTDATLQRRMVAALALSAVGYAALLGLLAWIVPASVAGPAVVVLLLALAVLVREADRVAYAVTKAVAISREDHPAAYDTLHRLAQQADVAPPALAVVPTDEPNAITAGRGDRSVVCVTLGLLERLGDDELEAVLAHELAHMETHDAFVQTVVYSLLQSLVGLVAIAVLPLVALAGGVARALALLRGRPESWSGSWFGVAQRRALQFVGLLGFAIALLALAYSRRREWAADDRAVEVTGNPLALARALGKIERASTPDLGPLTPLYVHGTEDDEPSRLLSTHPPMDERIERLRARAVATARTE